METRRLILAILAAFAVYVAYMWVYSRLRPAPVRTVDPNLPEALQPAGDSPDSGATTAPAAAAPASAPFSFTAGPSDEPITLGGEGQSLKVELSPRGASIASLWLTQERGERYVHREGPRDDAAYNLLRPVHGLDGRKFLSYSTHRIWVVERGNQSWPLDDLAWHVVKPDPQPTAADAVAFETTLQSADGAQLLRLTKSYRLLPTPLLMQMDLRIDNLGAEPLTVVVAQDGPTGIQRELVQQYEMRRLLGVNRKDGALSMTNLQRPAIKTAQDGGDPKKLSVADESARFAWTALLNKFFGVFTRPLAPEGGPSIVQSATALVDLSIDDNPGDLRARLFTGKLALPPQQGQTLRYEIYAGPRDADVLKAASAAFVDRAQVGYAIVAEADHGCCFCTFEPLPTLMSGLLRWIYAIVFNYGVAIIIVVLIIRTLLHPLSVFQQKSMYRMQESMGRIQPKLQALKERYANDKMKLNQEMMKLWAEENVNPAAGLVSFIPIFLQMPILVALWSAMNTEIQLRNAPFDGWWIVDLSAPDALISFGSGGLTIPILGWLPLIGWIFQDIPSFNLLPVLMGVSMYLQQKYMPKPAMQARMEAAQKQQTTPGTPNSFEEQMRQQRIAANMMSIMFPFMFYYMPAGLNLYWMSTNVFGICESLIIRRQLERERLRREQAGPPAGPSAPRKQGIAARIMRWMAEQGEQLQRQADDMTQQDKQRFEQKQRDSRRKR